MWGTPVLTETNKGVRVRVGNTGTKKKTKKVKGGGHLRYSILTWLCPFWRDLPKHATNPPPFLHTPLHVLTIPHEHVCGVAVCGLGGSLSQPWRISQPTVAAVPSTPLHTPHLVCGVAVCGLGGSLGQQWQQSPCDEALAGGGLPAALPSQAERGGIQGIKKELDK